MAARIPALVNPALLTWAREESGLSPESVARRISVRTDKLLAWEQPQADTRPTIRQAKALAKVYQRPLGLFFLPQPPSVEPLAAEYRRLPRVLPGRETPEMRLALRVMSRRRELALELTEELGANAPEFTFVAHLSEGPRTVGNRLREHLEVSNQEQIDWRSDWQALRRWREAIEAIGVLVFQFPKVPLELVRGLSLLRFPLPVVGINSKETAPGARAFTLMHELVHVALAKGKEELSALRERRDDVAWQEIESFAEEAASSALIPEDMLAVFLDRLTLGPGGWTIDLVRTLASKFRVTPLAMATRLRASQIMSWDSYQSWKKEWQRHVESLQPRTGGFASPVDKTIGRSGRPFVQLVLEAMDSNRITAVDACQYLDLRFHHFEELRSELRLGPGRSSTSPNDGE